MADITPIRLNSLAGGVSTKPATKRLPNEVSEAINCELTLEKSASKRPGSRFIAHLDLSTTDDHRFHVIDRGDDDEEYIVAVNGVSGEIKIFDAESGELKDTLTPTAEQAAYITAGDVQDLKFATVYDATLVLNPAVEAKFLNDGDGRALFYRNANLDQFVRAETVDGTTEESIEYNTQNRSSFSNFDFPPPFGAASAANGESDVIGLGRVYLDYDTGGVGEPNKFYKVINENIQPYYTKIRTESVGSMFDPATMPQLLFSNSPTNWSLSYAPWAHRTAGNPLSNPGPSVISQSADPWNDGYTYYTDGSDTSGTFAYEFVSNTSTGSFTQDEDIENTASIFLSINCADVFDTATENLKIKIGPNTVTGLTAADFLTQWTDNDGGGSSIFIGNTIDNLFWELTNADLDSTTDNGDGTITLNFINDDAAQGFARMIKKLDPNNDGTKTIDLRLSAKWQDGDGVANPTGGRIDNVVFFNERLVFSAGDNIFSSRINDIYNLWIEDPGAITPADPLDVRVRANKVTEISSMTPYYDSLFIQTKGRAQYLMQADGSLKVTSFYGASPEADSFRVGSQLLWLDKDQMYLFLPGTFEVESRSIDISRHIDGYLPSGKITAQATAEKRDQIFWTTEDSFTTTGTLYQDIYVYNQRFNTSSSQSQVCFHKWRLAGMSNIKEMYVFNDNLHVLGLQGTDSSRDWTLITIPMEVIDHTNGISVNDASRQPCLDLFQTVDAADVTYDSSTVTGTITIDGYYPDLDTVLKLENGNVTDQLTLKSVTTDDTSGSWQTTAVFGLHGGAVDVLVGTNYEMSLELSPVVLKDGNLQFVPGSHMVRSLSTRTYNSSYYEVKVEDRLNPAAAARIDQSSPLRDQQYLNGDVPVDVVRDSLTTVNLDAARAKITYTSSTPYDVNFSNIEIRSSVRTTTNDGLT